MRSVSKYAGLTVVKRTLRPVSGSGGWVSVWMVVVGGARERNGREVARLADRAPGPAASRSSSRS
jgi:hypothetical protein